MERLFTYLLCSLLVAVNEQHEAIWRTGFQVSTLSAAVCSVSPGRVSKSFKSIYFPTQAAEKNRTLDKGFIQNHLAVAFLCVMDQLVAHLLGGSESLRVLHVFFPASEDPF